MTRMKLIHVPVAEAKKRFSAYVGRSAHAGSRVVITKRNRPVAALVSLEDLQRLQQSAVCGGLAELAESWPTNAKFGRELDRVHQARRKEGPGRDVPL